MSALVVIVDMRPNNPATGALGITTEDDWRLEVFTNRAEIEALRKEHILGALPWIVVDLDQATRPSRPLQPHEFQPFGEVGKGAATCKHCGMYVSDPMQQAAFKESECPGDRP